MMTSDDITLVRAFATRHSEEAFAALVDRHLGLVHSAALRQVQDPHLAEEVAQNVFLTLARKAASLGPDTIVSAWLYRTTNYTAKDILRAQRRRQQREQEAHMQQSIATPESTPWEDIAPHLDDAMAQLGEADRAALVLRYFESKSAREIAHVLRTEEATAQKRVTRALQKLRRIFSQRGIALTTSALAAAISSNAVQAAPAGLIHLAKAAAATSAFAAAGAGATVTSGFLGKITGVLSKTVFSWSAPLFGVLSSLPSLLFVSMVSAVERRNFRDPEGFRPRLHAQWVRSFLWGFPVLMAAVFFFSRMTTTAFGSGGQLWFWAVLSVALLLMSLRSLSIARSPYHLGMFCYGLLAPLGFLGMSLDWWSAGAFVWLFLPGMALLLFVFPRRPVRMDYSLFLRAAHGLLPERPGDQRAILPLQAFRRDQLLAFARFLGGRFLITNFHWDRSGLRLILSPVSAHFLRAMKRTLWPFGGRSSSVLLGYNGSVTAHCSASDESDLQQITYRPVHEASALEVIVEESVRQGWDAFLKDERLIALAALGETAVADVFLVDPARSRATRWWKRYLGATILLFLLLGLLQIWHPAWMDRMHVVPLTEAQVRTFLSAPTPPPQPNQFSWNDPAVALFTSLALPSTNLFSTEGVRAMRNSVAGGNGFDAWKEQPERSASIWCAPLPRRAFAEGWISLEDLNLTTREVADALRLAHKAAPESWTSLLTRRQAWSWVQQERFEVRRIGLDGLSQLRLLQRLGCLDLIHRAQLIEQIAATQVSSPNLPDQPRRRHWRAMRGLFFTPCFPALQDTYFAIAALEILGGLDQIDHDACIRGILRHHRGRGFFTSPDSGGYNEYHIDGSARDTIAALESLRILGGLDRVHDLDRWEFRIRSTSRPPPNAQGVRPLTWDEVEAWVARTRLQQILRERQPGKPLPSLVSPLGKI